MNTAGVVLYLAFVPALIAVVSQLKWAYKGKSNITPEETALHDRKVNKTSASKRRRPIRFDPVARNAEFIRDQAWRDYERQYNAWVNLNWNNPNPPPPPVRPKGMC